MAARSTALAALLATGTASAAVPAGFSLVPLATGVAEPTAHAYAPDGRLFIAERAGRVLVQRPGLDATRSVFLDIRGDVNSNSERGLLGIALDPQFATRPRVFLFVTAERNPAAPDGPGEMGIEVWRYDQAPADPATGVVSSRRVVVEGPRTSACCHYGGTVRFDSRGRLLTAFGDTTDMLSSQRAGILNGRLIRVDPETGLGVADNPAFDPLNPGSVDSRTLARGFRNPFRFTVDPADDSVWVGDVGNNAWEELNRVPASGWTDVARDTNFGWPCFEGGSGSPLLTASAFSNSTWSAACRPIATVAEGGTGSGTAAPYYGYAHVTGQGASITAGPALRGQSYPAEYSGRVMVGDYSTDRFMTVGHDGARDFGTIWGFGNPVDIAMTPDGDVSYAAIGAGAIRSIVWTAGNRPPTVSQVTAEALADAAPRTVRFSASASDPDGDPLTYRWDLGDGVVTAGPTLTHTYGGPISHDVVVTVSDARRGGVAVGSVHVDVGNTAPSVRLGHDAPPAGFAVGQTLRVSLAADDAEEGALGPAALSWRATRIHLDHRHPMAAGDGATGELAIPDHGDDPSWIELVGRAADAHGAVAEATVRLDPRRVRMSVSGGPGDTSFVLDGSRVASPHFWDSIVGGTHTVIAPEAAEGRPFRAWQIDDEEQDERTLTFVTPSTPGRATAHFGAIEVAPRSADAAPVKRAPAPLRATLRRRGGWIVVTATAGRSGRVTVVVSDGGRPLGSCRQVPLAAGATFRCRVRPTGPAAPARHLRATVALRTAVGRHTLRLRLGR